MKFCLSLHIFETKQPALKKGHLFIIVLIAISFQGCFEVVEQIQLKKDGSGSFQLTFNLSQSKAKINSMLKLQTVNGHPVPTKDAITARIKGVENTIAKTEGISNVKTSIDFDNYIFVISYDFTSVAQLNKSIKNIKQKENLSGAMLDDNYAYDAKSKIFQRKNKVDLKALYAKMSNADKEVFSGANYTCIYKFEAPVIAATNKDSKIAANKKAVLLRETTLDLLTEKKSIENKINIAQ